MNIIIFNPQPGVMSPLKASVVKNPSAVYLQSEPKYKHNPNKYRLDLNRLDLRQTWQGLNGLDSPTAGYNINTRTELKATTWLLIENKKDHMTRTNQWGQDT